MRTSPPRPSTATSTGSGSGSRVNDECSELQPAHPGDAALRPRSSDGRSRGSTATGTPRGYDPATARLHGLRRPLGGAKQSTRPHLPCSTRSSTGPGSWSARVGAGAGRGWQGGPAWEASVERRGRGGGSARVTVRRAARGRGGGAHSSRPRLLLRSGIGGPATGEHLYLHPPRPRSATTARTCRPGGERPERADQRVRRHRRRLRVPDRGRAVHDRSRCLRLAVDGRSAAQGRAGGLPRRRRLRRPHT